MPLAAASIAIEWGTPALIILLGFLGWSTIAGVNVALTLPGIAG